MTGTIVPQMGLNPGAARMLQEQYPSFSALLFYAGFFDIFNSGVFFFLLTIFFINLFLCSLKTALQKKMFLSPPFSLKGIGHWGFIIIHISLLLLTASVFLEQGFQASGHFLVKEGMWFRGEKRMFRRDGYRYGRFRSEETGNNPLAGGAIFFQKLLVDYVNGWPVKKKFMVQMHHPDGRKIPAVIGVNHPLEMGHLEITFDDYGFAPSFIIKEKKSGKVVMNGPGVLPPLGKAGFAGQNRFPLPDGAILIVDLHPNAKWKDRKSLLVENHGPALKKPILILGLMRNDRIVERRGLDFKPGSDDTDFAELGGYLVGVSNIEYWASFILAERPFYFLLVFSIWFFLFGLLLFVIKMLGKKSWVLQD